MTRRPSTWPSAIQALRCYIKEAGLPFHLMRMHERGHCIGPAAYLHNSNAHARLSRFELRHHDSNQSTSRYAHHREQSSALCFLATSQWQVRPLRGPVKTLVYIGYTVSFAKASTMDAVLEQVRTNCRQIMCMHLHMHMLKDTSHHG